MLIYSIVTTFITAFVLGFIAGYFTNPKNPRFKEEGNDPLLLEPFFSKDVLAFLKYDGTMQEG